MPSGPKKRKAAAAAAALVAGERQGSPDRDSTSDSGFADEGASSFNKPRQSSKRLSLDLKEGIGPSDQTFQTEEWVRVSDFDVGTPSSTTADTTVEDSFSDFREHEKLADWETISRDAVGTSSSLTDYLEVDQQVADESLGRNFSLPYVDAGRSEGLVLDQEGDDTEHLSEPQDSSEDASVSSEETHVSTRDLSSSIVEIASQGEQDDEDHGSLVEVTYPEEQGDEDQASNIVDISSIAEQEEDKYSSIVDVASLDDDQESDDQDGSVVVVASKADEEVDNYACIFRGSYMSEERDDEAHVTSTLAASVPTILSDENQAMATGVPGIGSCLREDEQSISMAGEASLDDNRSIEAEQFTLSELQEGGGNSVQKPDAVPMGLLEEHDRGLPEPEMHVLDELLDTADSKEPARLGKQEEEVFSTEEKDIEKHIAEPQMERMPAILDATSGLSEPLNWGEVVDLHPVLDEETPLDEDGPDSQDAALHDDAELSNSSNAEECPTEHRSNDAAVEGGEQESTMIGATSIIDHGPKPEAPLAEDPQTDGIPAEKEETPVVMSSFADDGTEAIAVPTEKEVNVVQIRISPSPELQRSLAEPSKCTAIVSFFGKGFSIGGPGGPPTYLLQFITLKKAEEQNRPLEHWQGTRDLAGCCEPVQWLFDLWFGSHST